MYICYTSICLTIQKIGNSERGPDNQGFTAIATFVTSTKLYLQSSNANWC